MKLNKIIFCDDKNIENILLSKNLIKEIKKGSDLSLYESSFENSEQNKIYVFFKDFSSALDYIKDNYDIFKIAIIGNSEIVSSSEIKPSDIIIPNTFISYKNETPIFIDYAIGENYDLNKFGLVLNGILLSGDLNEKPLSGIISPSQEKEATKKVEFVSDIKDENTYNYLYFIKKDNFLDKTVVIKYIKSEKESENIMNLINIVDLVI